MKVLFLGSSRFSKIILENLLKNGINIACVITAVDKPSGRGQKLTPTEVKTFALENNVEVKTFDKFRLHLQEVKDIDYDIAVVASYGQILPEEFLEHRPCINVHPSLLPKYRGASPIQSAILNGDKVTGVSIMEVVLRVDAGDVLAQEEVVIDGEYYLQLEEKLAAVGAKLLLKVLKNYKNIKKMPQNDDEATFTRKFNKEDGFLSAGENADDLINKVRALSQNEGTFLCLGDINLKVFKLEKVEGLNLKEGEILNNKKRLVFGCKNGALAIAECLSPSGKKISGRDFVNGHNEILNLRVKC